MKILLRNTNGMLTLLLGVVVFIFYAFFYKLDIRFCFIGNNNVYPAISVETICFNKKRDSIRY